MRGKLLQTEFYIILINLFSEGPKRRKVATHICTDENFKALKVKKAELELMETERRIALIEAQVNKKICSFC